MIEQFLGSGVLELKEKLGPINWQFPPSARFEPSDFQAFLELLPKSLEGRALRHAVEVRHGSFRTQELVDMARHYGVALVIAADSRYPQIADVTAPFVYVRLMGTHPGEPLGYPAAALDRWAQRARRWAEGGIPEGLETIVPPQGGPMDRDVYLYVISGHKVANPAAAQALMQRAR